MKEQITWINLKDKLPKANGFPVLCRIKDSSALGAVTIVAYPPAGASPFRWIIELPDKDYSRQVDNSLVTHWMPLPAPPNEA